MAEPTAPHAAALEGVNPATARRIKRVTLAVLLLVVAGTAYATWRYISTGESTDRWEELAQIERQYAETSNRAWLEASAAPSDLAQRDLHVQRLGQFLSANDSRPALAAHVHARMANVLMTQVVALAATGGSTALVPTMDAAKKHLEILRDNYPDAAINWQRFARGKAASVTRVALTWLEGFRTWTEKYGLRPVEPDPDVVAVLRTTEGDLRLKFYSSASPKLVASFLQRICTGALDGTALFEKREDSDEGWIRGGDVRTQKPSPTDADRATWGTPTPGEALLPEEGRNRILHTKGVVSAWHAREEIADDPALFLIVTKPSPTLDYDYTPFARVDGELSFSTLERLAARRARAQDKPEIRADPSLHELADQFTSPVLVVRALVYEKGALKACIDPSKVADDEKRLDTLKPDARREAPPTVPATPTAPPAAPPAGAGSPPEAPTPPAMDVK